MANSPQARKRAIQNETRRVHNKSRRTTMRTQIKNVLKAIKSGDKQRAEEAFKTATPLIDRMATKGIIHKNKAARHKSRLNSRIRALG
ncbi:30S ribosomal protein S20 [Aquisalimonas sp. 2447]|uniref:30S ribosomal protein S20 n=1 Tax=Aquisalimonas sp. 2447 TaxID=2740807 RepID=UPI00143259DD|nr:30S ribosomal protein S20 [Aquisalimonas sp. 2447]QIT56249.1 30S ribosomal protein S20 [Aquisalimonas sp. 2447]